MQRVVRVGGARMAWPGVGPAGHTQPGRRDGVRQFLTGPQPEAFGQVGQDEPAFSAGEQTRGEAVEEGVEHRAAGVVDALFDGGDRTSGQPGRVAHHECGAARRVERRSVHLDASGEAEAGDVLPCAGQGARRGVGGHHPFDAPAGQHGGEHPGAGAQVEGGARARAAGGRQRCAGDQVDVLAPDGCEDTVVGVEAGAERGHLHTLLAPPQRAEHAQQFGERHHVRSPGRAVRLRAGPADVGGPAQRQGVVAGEADQQHAQDAGAVAAGLAVPVERPRRVRIRFRRGRGAVDPPGQGVQQLTGVVVVAAPQQRGAVAGEPVGGRRLHAVVGEDDASRCRGAVLRVPGRVVRDAFLGPGDVFVPAVGGHRVLLGCVTCGGTERAATRSAWAARVVRRMRLPLPRRSAGGGVAENHAERHEEPFPRRFSLRAVRRAPGSHGAYPGGKPRRARQRATARAREAQASAR
ncbi:hypothetical protein SCATT_p06930 (plasmid) [Streptantibioticus cattleyicolor NRRL 8057 = DSM 46488]|uniref:Uncharacterized protein n=1 Tax=Streptantibioticus cattleyicolor (strain ATCC 35852 / DSM 46488 / JCM 4925 / NBRC 14057 / NRRL 8057) TaxID=1003195 RepID=G8XHE0_STREN|nr:hypothetical protein SCATT_p06930 [Streptantibioticus cattleyicolor NRRL 8057 = DSM 46488]